MSRHQHLHPGHYDQGLALYRAGQTIKDLFKYGEALDASGEAAYDAAPTSEIRQAVSEEMHAAVPSLIAGFADGFLADIRALAGSRRGTTA